MKTTLMLVSALALAAPALAQQATPPAGDTAKVEAKTAVDTQAAADTTIEANAAVAADAAVEADAATTTDSATAVPTPTATPTPTPQASVAAIVSAEFPSYDKDANGQLSQAEFSDWMIALRTKSEAAAAPAVAELKTWAGAAFAQADTDKNATVSQPELTVFLQG